MLYRCFHCNRDLFKRGWYCSVRCQRAHKYQRDKEEIKKRARAWEKENPEKVKESRKKAHKKQVEKGNISRLMKKYYQKDKDKINCRGKTRLVMDSLNLPKVCRKCGSVENIEIHHEIYPDCYDEIRKAISNKEIYYLCLSCHGIRTSHKIKHNFKR